MIVTRKEAKRLLGKDLRGPEYAGKRWFLLSMSIPHKNLGGFPTKDEAVIHERQVQFFKRRNPGRERVAAAPAGRLIWKAMRGKSKFSAAQASENTDLTETETMMGIAWLHEHGFVMKFPFGNKYKVVSQKNPLESNPKPFLDRKHDWSEVLISQDGKKVTRKQILNYYKKHKKKIWPFLKGQTVMVVLGIKRNEFIRRRHGPAEEFIKLKKIDGIEDPSSFEYWIYRRTIEFHPTLMAATTPLLWLDLDMHSTRSASARAKLLSRMKRAVPKLKAIFKEMGVSKVFVYTSGATGGLHLEGNLSKRKPVDALRRKFTKRLSEAFDSDPVFTTGIAKSGQIRLDTTTLHKLGSLRAPYSMTVYGGAKKPLKGK
jgi:DNA primase